MGLFNFLSSKKTGPYKKDYLNELYELLFCDKPELYLKKSDASAYPFNMLVKDSREDNLIKIINDSSLNTRYHILAYNLLQARGKHITEKKLLGVIVEMALPGGLDVLAAYADGTARYFNHAESLTVWDMQTEKSNQIISELFKTAENVVSKIGPWEKPRRPFPTNGNARITFLVSDGLYFGEANGEVFQKDPMAGPVLYAAVQLLSFLVNQQK